MKLSFKTFTLAALLGLAQAPTAQAQVLDEIEIAQDTQEARIQFNVPVHYLRHFPVGNAETYEIFFQIISSEGIEQMPSDEYKVAPDSDKVPHFTVTYPQGGATRLILKFSRAVSLQVRLGDDNRSFLLSIQPASEVSR